VERKITNMKKQIKFLTIIFSTFVLLLAYQNCSNSMKPMDLDGSSTASNSSSYTADELNTKSMTLLQNKCASCHSAGVALGGIDYITDLGSLEYYRLVIPGQAVLSPLYSVLSNSVDHSSILSQNESQIIFNWIETGLLNQTGGVAPPSITPLTPTYASLASKVFVPNCTRCHNATTRSGGVDLSTYNAVKAYTNTTSPDMSQIYISVTTKANLMPVGGAPLTTEQKKALRDWIADGAQNN
jgi:uncharacterized membrane protein